MANEQRLIDANALEAAITVDYYEHFTQCHDTDQIALIDMVREDIGNAPTVDAVEVVHGRWDTTCLTGGFAEEWGYVCSVCGCTVSDESGLGKYQGSNQQLNYCPNCGAKMDGGNEDG